MSPDNRRLFLLGEFSGAVATFRFDAATGTLELAGVSTMLPPGSTLVPGSARPAAGGPERTARGRSGAPTSG